MRELWQSSNFKHIRDRKHKKRTCVKHSPIKRWRKLKHEFCTIKMKAMVDTEQELCSNRGIRKKWFKHFTTERFIHVIKCHSVHRPQNPHECWWRLRYAIDQNDNDNRFFERETSWKNGKTFYISEYACRPPFTRSSKLAQYSIFIDVKQALTRVPYMENSIHARKYCFVTHAFSHCRASHTLSLSLSASHQEEWMEEKLCVEWASGETTHNHQWWWRCHWVREQRQREKKLLDNKIYDRKTIDREIGIEKFIFYQLRGGVLKYEHCEHVFIHTHHHHWLCYRKYLLDCHASKWDSFFGASNFCIIFIMNVLHAKERSSDNRLRYDSVASKKAFSTLYRLWIGREKIAPD